MTTRMFPICVGCVRLHAADTGQIGFTCDAFPGGIPRSILENKEDHRAPVTGDHGLRFVPKSASDRAYANSVFRALPPAIRSAR